MTAKKKGFAQRNFNDRDTGDQFKAGDPVEVAEGVYGNYEAAGLVAGEKPKADAEAASAAEPGAKR